MKMKLLLGGFYYKNSERIQLDPVESPDKSSLIEMLKIIKNQSGIITLKQIVSNHFGPNKLTLYSENGSYLIIYGSYQEDGDYLVLTLHSENRGLINILGEPYPAHAVTEDFSIIERIFISFLSTGKPSKMLK